MGIPRLATFSLAAGIALGQVMPAHAALIDRGGGLIFDADRNITWLANANLGAGSAYDDGFSTTDGAMSWQSAVSWAANLSYGGYDDWRLPNTPVPDATCATPPPAFGINCTGSELGHLYVTELAGTVLDPPTMPTSAPGPGPFSNIKDDGYWSGTAYDATFAYVVNFGFSGAQAADNKSIGYFAWAVRDGDVAAVPAPGTAMLLVTGLLAVARHARRRLNS
jgi:hypothetical protein